MSQSCLAYLLLLLLQSQLPTLPCQLKELLQLFRMPNASYAAEGAQSPEQGVVCSSKSCPSLQYAGIWSPPMVVLRTWLLHRG